VHVNLNQGLQAREQLTLAAAKFWQVSDLLGIAECLETLAELALKEQQPGSHQSAAKLFGAALGVRRSSGAALGVITCHAGAAHLCRKHHVEWQIGEELSVQEAVKLASAVSFSS
jgi:hypothetical protein